VTNSGALTASGTAGQSQVTVSGATLPPFSNTTLNATPPTPPAFTVISLGGPGSPDAHVPVVSCAGSTITLAVPLQNTYSAAPLGLLVATGKTWGPYLKPDDFKVVYVVANVAPAGGTAVNVSLPVLEDIWGGPILYFPSYNSYANQTLANPQGVSRAVTSATTTFPPVGNPAFTPSAPAASPPATVGPLLGLPASAGYNTPVPTLGNASASGPSIFWDGPLGYFGGPVAASSYAPLSPTPFTPGQVAAVLVKLGDQNINNAIDSGETFNVQLPYFLLSPGPDGMFQDLSGNAQGDWNRIMSKSDDVYSFDQ
jgi:hypothetical protein